MRQRKARHFALTWYALMSFGTAEACSSADNDFHSCKKKTLKIWGDLLQVYLLCCSRLCVSTEQAAGGKTIRGAGVY
jgi:SET domain-containing protein